MDSKQLQAHKQHSALLTQFIMRLSVFYEGFSKTIDDELKILRGHLSGTPNFTLAAVSIDKLNSAIQHQDLTLKKYNANALSTLESTMKSLQRVVFEDTDLKEKSTKALITLNQPLGDVFSLYSHFQVALTLHQTALNNKIETIEPENGSTDATTSDLYGSILEELNQLIVSYAQRKPNDAHLEDIKARLATGMTDDQLLQSCVVILRMIVQDAMSEASITGKVIQGLHNSLGNVGKDIKRSIDGSQHQYEQRQASHAQLQSHLDTIEEAVSESESFEALKAQTQYCVKNLAATLSERMKADSDGQDVLMHLFTSMQSQIETLQKQTSVYKKKLAEQLILSQTDPLTRLPNRQAYNDRLQRAYAKWQKTRGSLAIAVLDIDHFKSINDRFGHAAGDKTLQIVGRHLKKHINSDEFIARWGGEEFIMLIPKDNIALLKERLDTMRTNLASLPFKFKDQKVSITASFGVACFEEGDTPEMAFERADKCLYQAKRNGRNCVITDKELTP